MKNVISFLAGRKKHVISDFYSLKAHNHITYLLSYETEQELGTGVSLPRRAPFAGEFIVAKSLESAGNAVGKQIVRYIDRRT